MAPADWPPYKPLGLSETSLQSYLMYIPQSSSSSTTPASSRSTSPTTGGNTQVGSGNQEVARIAIVVNGSRGDNEPMVALAQALIGYGHKVQMLTNINFVDICSQNGIDAISAFPDTEWLLQQLGGLSGTGTDVIRWVAREAMEACPGWETANPGVLVAPEDALKKFRPHLVICSCQAVHPSMSYEKDTNVPAIIMHASRASLELYGGLELLKPSRPSFFAVSEFFDNKALKKQIMRTGPWIFEKSPTKAQLAKGGSLYELQMFLNQNKKNPVVAMGWGSMYPRGMSTHEMLWLALTALSMANRRGVIIGGWARLDELGHQLLAGTLTGNKWRGLADFAATEVYFINSVPHSWLFPKCSCVVHHGGAGTAQTALRTGTPTVVTPIFADQFETSERVRVLSAGVGFESPLPEITPKELVHAITRAERMADNAMAGKMAMGREDGARRAARVIEDFLQQEVLTGEWRKQQLKEQVEISKLHTHMRGRIKRANLSSEEIVDRAVARAECMADDIVAKSRALWQKEEPKQCEDKSVCPASLDLGTAACVAEIPAA